MEKRGVTQEDLDLVPEPDTDPADVAGGDVGCSQQQKKGSLRGDGGPACGDDIVSRMADVVRGRGCQRPGRGSGGPA
jgi:hypothetical protein